MRYLALPFHLAPLLLVALFAVPLHWALQAGLLGLPLVFIVGSWFLKYAFVLLDHAAEGRPDAPVLSLEDANPLGEARPILFAVVIALGYAASRGVDALLGPDWGSAARAMGMAALPAVIAVHAVTGSFLQALGPTRISGMIWRLGSGYVRVLVIAIACALLAQWIVVDANGLALLLRIALLMLLWLVLFAALGGVIHERRLDLGFDPEHSPERAEQRETTSRARERDRFIDQVFAEYRAGSQRNAWVTIERRAGQGSAALEEYAWIYARVAQWPNPGLAERIARALLPLLLAARRNGEAVALVRERLQADAAFRPASGEHVIRVAQLARDAGDRPLARALIDDFEQRFPEHPARGSARQLAAGLALR